MNITITVRCDFVEIREVIEAFGDQIICETPAIGRASLEKHYSSAADAARALDYIARHTQ